MEEDLFKITTYVRIKDCRILLNGEEVIYDDASAGNNFLKKAYKGLNIEYPKFFKMDWLCKLGILATEVLFLGKTPDPDTALIFSNSRSSLDTDLKHQDSIAGIVSPAVFVYTLPNIVLGEISIRQKLQSENAFFIEKKFNPKLLYDYSTILLKTGKAAAVVSGWIDLKNDEYDVFLCHISPEGEIPFSEENLEHLYYFENE
ncbi:hypothetical protein LZ575_02840 [Antarcticibacterium sp. 1MA-6-2]|uniref:hypothetical protein n=1 Tax=Antarcticibacterium sp. 1MA-6-2 TaxID=2908210 RepID=UPI001F1C95D5|nr:hypothetical protein [Antarcticibacterium sp. 1MA-6-2]UJH91646.1 hypothetical protein LZ575_02840 [Antarcticibacterium sp. 1MA-6-2]